MQDQPASGDPAALSDLFPFCCELRSKKLCFAKSPPRSPEDILDGSNRVWCAHTMQAIGPDNELVHPDDCRAGRGCFRGIL